jgi:hypothetical protein
MILLQATVLPQYQGSKMKGIKAETDIFEGMKFGTLLGYKNIAPGLISGSGHVRSKVKNRRRG